MEIPEDLADLFTEFDEEDRLIVVASSDEEIVFMRQGTDARVCVDGLDVSSGGYTGSTEAIYKIVHLLNCALKLSGHRLALESVRSGGGKRILFGAAGPSFQELARMEEDAEANHDSLEPAHFEFSLQPLGGKRG